MYSIAIINGRSLYVLVKFHLSVFSMQLYALTYKVVEVYIVVHSPFAQKHVHVCCLTGSAYAWRRHETIYYITYKLHCNKLLLKCRNGFRSNIHCILFCSIMTLPYKLTTPILCVHVHVHIRRREASLWEYRYRAIDLKMV